jgi:hypothetical protein
MVSQGGGDGSAPYDGVAELTATPEADRRDLEPTPGYASWVRSVNEYTRQVTGEFQAARYG